LPDQDPGERGGVFSTFFNQKVKTMTLLTKLCRKNNSKVLLTWGKRLAKGKGYEINIKPINILSKTNKLEDDLALMNKAIEDLIKTQPEQYLWSYEKFKSAITY
jgi:KDO2-lipid IV(A) lauroyltransferase